jgi:hypothetical protein
VVARTCGIDRCRAITPCFHHGSQVIVRFCVDGKELPEFKIAKKGFASLEEFHHRDVREIFHMLADFALNAITATPTMPVSAAVDAINHRAFQFA